MTSVRSALILKLIAPQLHAPLAIRLSSPPMHKVTSGGCLRPVETKMSQKVRQQFICCVLQLQLDAERLQVCHPELRVAARVDARKGFEVGIDVERHTVEAGTATNPQGVAQIESGTYDKSSGAFEITIVDPEGMRYEMKGKITGSSMKEYLLNHAFWKPMARSWINLGF